MAGARHGMYESALSVFRVILTRLYLFCVSILQPTISEINQNADMTCGSGCPVLVVSVDRPLSDLFVPLAVWLLRICN
jgi:hypothetical protein